MRLLKRDTLLVTVAPCWRPPAASCACGWPCLSCIPPARRWSPSPLRTTCCSRSSHHAPRQRAACVCWPLSACVSHAAKLGIVAACQQPQAVKVTMKVHQRPTESLFICAAIKSWTVISWATNKFTRAESLKGCVFSSLIYTSWEDARVNNTGERKIDCPFLTSNSQINPMFVVICLNLEPGIHSQANC